MARERMMLVLVDQGIFRKEMIDLSKRWKAVDEVGQNLM
jgi:hypothetical protein